MRLRNLVVLLVFLLAITGILGCSDSKENKSVENGDKTKQAEQTAKQKTLKIGAALSLTGSFASEGGGTQKGYEVWRDFVNSQGGVEVGSEKYLVEFVFYDDKSDPETAGKLVEKLITEDKVNMIFGPYGSDLNMVGSAIAERYGVVFIAPMAAAAPLYERGFKYFFGTSTIATNEIIGYPQLMKTLKPEIKTAAIIFPDLVYPMNVAENLKKALEEAGIKIAYFDKYPPGTKDLAPLLTKIKSLKPDAFFSTAFLEDAILTGRQIEAVNLGAKMVGYAGVSSHPSFLESLKADAENSFGLSVWVPELNYECKVFGSSLKYAEIFEKEFGYKPRYYEASASGAAVVLQLALKDAGSLDKDQLSNAIRKLDVETFWGAVGFDDKHRNIKHQIGIHQVQNGKPVIVWPVERQTSKPVYPRP